MASTIPSDNGTLAQTPKPEPQSETTTTTTPTTATAVVETDVKPEAEAALEAGADKIPPATNSATAEATTAEKKWPGWPGECVFRLIVPVLKVGSIIGRKGDIIKKMCEDTRARIRVLDAPVGTPDRIVSCFNLVSLISFLEWKRKERKGKERKDFLSSVFRPNVGGKGYFLNHEKGRRPYDLHIMRFSNFNEEIVLLCNTGSWVRHLGAVYLNTYPVLISGKEETELPLSPAMDAVIRVFKRVNGFPENENEGMASVPFCSIRLLVPSMQAISLIGKQGSSIKSIQESTGCSVRVLTACIFGSERCFLETDEALAISSNPDERVVDLQGEALKVLKALEAVVGHLRKFLVDRSVLPLFEKANNATATQEPQVETWADKPMMRTGSQQHGIGGDFSLPVRRETLFLDREPQRESQFSSHGLSLYGRDPALPPQPVLLHLVIAQTMQIPLVYAEDIIGVGGTNIAYIRRTSGAILTVQESRGLPDEITVEIKGTSSQVQTAQQLIQECVNGHKESIPSSYGKMESGLRSSYSQLGGNSSFQSSSSAYGGQSYGGGYGGGSGLGGYSSYRINCGT
ncbi:hypothetical protein OSB04_021050 [Centaurea solstitialis]|uniref:K Homology domain-containing protein n=1 Tax=Centaurea solstitialis TaxID=347529 RepID=A0AA38W6G3_9ASTR|nr:hypothetical protein OSB04_021050 [Centaurea solstitialis]